MMNSLVSLKKSDVEAMSGPELVQTYNDLLAARGLEDMKPVKKFSDRKTGIARVLKELEELRAEEPDLEPISTSEVEPVSLEPDDKFHHHRKGTRRGKMIEAMRDGATMPELVKITGWDERKVRQTMRLINLYTGYGIEERDGQFFVTGVIKGRKPFDLQPLEEVRSHRPGTKRATTIDLLSREEGATVEEVMEATGWSYRTALEGIKLIHSYLGYGLREDDDSRIYLVRP